MILGPVAAEIDALTIDLNLACGLDVKTIISYSWSKRKQLNLDQGQIKYLTTSNTLSTTVGVTTNTF